jgi:hypothetical protein
VTEDQDTSASLDSVRSVAEDVLRALSLAGYAASAVIALLMVVLWIRSDHQLEVDFPGRYLFALLPVLAASVTLDWSSGRIRSGRVPTHRPW